MKIMATEVLVSVEEYLRTSYRPDCDYLDGEVVERNLGEKKHSRAQREILFFLGGRYPQLRELLFPEQRVQVRTNRYRIPDICIIAAEAADQEIITTPPDLCVEILSPEDTMTRTLDRIKDYFTMGVPTCWIIDPVSREGWVATPGHLEQAIDGILRARGIEMPLSEVLG
jgi:Uma2 family endonuclease